jgi:hypothetical protein
VWRPLTPLQNTRLSAFEVIEARFYSSQSICANQPHPFDSTHHALLLLAHFLLPNLPILHVHIVSDFSIVCLFVCLFVGLLGFVYFSKIHNIWAHRLLGSWVFGS